MQFTVYKLRSNKNKYGMFMSNNKHVFGVGKGKCRMLERGEDISNLDKKQLIYNPTYLSLPATN
jgi:hypothetical protein